MISARQMIEQVTNYLVDDDDGGIYANTHWSEDDLLDYFRLAVDVVASTQKDKFIKRTTVKLVEGMVQDVPTHCHDAPAAIFQKGGRGLVTPFPRKTSTVGMHLKGKIGCPECEAKAGEGKYKIASWSLDPDDPNLMYVDPPVPEGENVELVISCYVPPSVDNADSEIDLPSSLRPAVFHLMLSYAYGRDTESVPYRDRSATHWNQAIQLIGGDKAAQLSNRYSSTRIPELRIGAKK